MDLKEKYKNWKKVRRQKKLKKSQKNFKNKYEELRDKIYIEYPELTASSIRNGKEYSPSFHELVRAYYELKWIETQRWHNRLIVVLTIAVIVLTILQIKLQFFP